MNHHLSSSLFFTAFLAIAPITGRAQDPGGPGRGGPRDDTPVGKEMGGIGNDFRKLSRQYADPAQKAASLDLVSDMEKHVATAKTLEPSKAAKLTGDEKKKYLDTFHADLDELATVLADLKKAIDAGQNDAAKTEVDKIAHLKMTSHKELGVGGGGRRGPGGPEGKPPMPPMPPVSATTPAVQPAATP